MKRIILWGLMALLTVSCRPVQEKMTEEDLQLQAVLEVIDREVPWMKGKVTVSHLELPEGKQDAYEYETPGKNRLHIRATSIPAAGMAFNHYLKNHCHRSLSMTGSNLAPVKTLPLLEGVVKGQTDCSYRHFFNFCTLNYSGAFWDWPDWEKMIDYMVLNGINLTIATTGLEKVWYNTLSQYGFSEQEIFDFVPGPAFNAWHVMGNLEGWGGPITPNMMDKRARLGRQITDALRKYQIQAIAPAFYGMVPTPLKEKYPQADIIPQGKWVGDFVRPDILSPLDPLYEKMAGTYYQELSRVLGEIRFFAGEPFHEGGRRDGIDIPSMSAAVFAQMRKAHPEACWFLQAWGDNPSSEFLSGLSRDNDVLIWDFRGEQSAEWERRGGYEGFPFLWGVINNFGETTGLYGKLERFVQEYFRSAQAYPENMQGLGCSAEGILNNPVNYDLLFELPWHQQPFAVREWLHSYVAARYGSADPDMLRVWEILLETAYSSTADPSKIDPISHELPQIVGTPESLICAIPSLNVRSASAWGTSALYYPVEALEAVVPHLIRACPRLAGCDAFNYDLVNIVRQLLANDFHRHYDAYVEAVAAEDLSRMDAESAAMLRTMDKMEEVLSTRKEFMLGNWTAQALAFGDTEAEKALCLWNAKAQVSYWGGENTVTSLRDYAHKEWAGLISSLYRPRWEKFFAAMEARITDPQAVPEDLSEPVFTAMSIAWSHSPEVFSSEPSADPVEVAVSLLKDF